MTEAAPVLDAATVILLREETPSGFTVYLMKRSRGHNFMASAYVFPGGRMDAADCDGRLANFTAGFDGAAARRRLQEPELEEDKALGLYACAVRETFEEAGVLLAVGSDGSPAVVSNDYRERVYDTSVSLPVLAETFSLCLDFAGLIPYARWITPEIEAKRFDTRFFLAVMPAAQRAEYDNHEMVEATWMTPAQALTGHEAGQMMLMPPTLKTLLEISRFDTIAQLLDHARGKTIFPVLPQPFMEEETYGVLLPWDPDYVLEGYKQKVDTTVVSRLVMRNGRWQTFFPDTAG